ncbi:MAG TPA: GMC family oxidoreductase [Terriglobia bacterium]|nr:GMC family oxidoreductase [Terriglobia bacterium]
MSRSPQNTYDVLVVGSGASGGWAAKKFSEAGLKVAIVDAGRLQSDENFSEHKPGFELKFRNMAPELIRKTRPVQKDCYACTEYNYDWFCNDLDEPYTTDEGMPFSWQGRMRVTGGRTNVWGRLSLRLSDLDFKAASRDGYGQDWPISYNDLAPYYDEVEQYIGVCGQTEGVSALPDGKFQPPMPLVCSEVLVRDRLKKHGGYVLTPCRCANLTKPLNGRAACHYCGPCERGCVTHSYFNSYFTTVADALHTGNCTLIPNAMVYKVLMDTDRNKAKGVLYIDRITRQPKEVCGRVVALCAQSLESVRVLFNSANRQYPNGLGNSSGTLGHYLMDHIYGGGAVGYFPELGGNPTLGGPVNPAGSYIIRFRNVPGRPPSKDFIRGYGFQTGAGVDFNWKAPGFGDAFKKALLEPVQAFSLHGYGECLARWENYVEINPNVVDVFGIPVLNFHMKYGGNELAQVKDMAESAGEMLEATGAKNVTTFARPSIPGWSIHEVGVARMGKSPKDSVLNQFQQSHDIKNLFVLDGSAFTSSGCQNSTLTIMALCTRSSDYLLAEMKRGNL